MPWVDASEFDRLCQGELRGALESSDSIRKKAIGRFWLFGILALVAAAVLFAIVAAAAPPAVALFVALIVAVLGFVVASVPLNSARKTIKQPIAQAIARQSGLSYVEKGFDPPGYHATRPLFGSVTSATFGDLFHGQVDGRRMAVYDAVLVRRAGKNSTTVFQGQIWWLERRPPYPSETVIVPDRGFFNWFKPRGGMQRVSFPDHPDFERTFEAYGDNVPASTALLTREARDWLAGVKQEAGRTLVQLQGDHVVLALWGKDRFEPGSMFKSTPGVERARLMYNDLQNAVDFGRRLGAIFPEGGAAPPAS